MPRIPDRSNGEAATCEPPLHSLEASTPKAAVARNNCFSLSPTVGMRGAAATHHLSRAPTALVLLPPGAEVRRPRRPIQGEAKPNAQHPSRRGSGCAVGATLLSLRGALGRRPPVG